MTIAQTDEVTPQKPLRLWPGVVAVVLQWLVRFVVPVVVPGAIAVGMIGELLGGVTIVVWWLFFSRAPWSERVCAIVLMGVALFATPRIVHKSIATGMMGMMFVIYAIPLLSLAFVAWAVASRRLSSGPRRASMVAAILLGCGVLALVRTGGITGDADSDFHWRWDQAPEQPLLARARGDLHYTQEQRGDDEVVACYRLTTGEPVWRHRDAARFWESNAGAGPRSTPTLSDGRVYTMGATGIVNALDARDGSVVWSRNAASDTGHKVPGWGFASSP